MSLPVPSPHFLFKTTILVILIRIGLWVLPFRVMRKLIEKNNNTKLQPSTWPTPEQITGSVLISSQRVPQASCLTQALAAKYLLQKYGHPAELRIGITRSSNSQFEAHAWVESNEKIVIGGTKTDLEQFTELPAFENRGL